MSRSRRLLASAFTFRRSSGGPGDQRYRPAGLGLWPPPCRFRFSTVFVATVGCLWFFLSLTGCATGPHAAEAPATDLSKLTTSASTTPPSMAAPREELGTPIAAPRKAAPSGGQSPSLGVHRRIRVPLAPALSYGGRREGASARRSNESASKISAPLAQPALTLCCGPSKNRDWRSHRAFCLSLPKPFWRPNQIGKETRMLFTRPGIARAEQPTIPQQCISA